MTPLVLLIFLKLENYLCNILLFFLSFLSAITVSFLTYFVTIYFSDFAFCANNSRYPDLKKIPFFPLFSPFSFSLGGNRLFLSSGYGYFHFCVSTCFSTSLRKRHLWNNIIRFSETKMR